MGHEADDNGDRFEQPDADLFRSANQKGKHADEKRGGNAMPHASMHRVRRKISAMTKRMKKVDPARDQDHHFVTQSNPL